MSRIFMLLAGLSGALAVMLGAFGAHALRGKLEPRMLEVYETAVRYQFYHALALLLVALLARQITATALTWSGWCFAGGTVLFCGSLYVLSLRHIAWLGPVTPLGGLLFIAGWLALALAAWRN